MGISDDGSYVYFAATEALTSDATTGQENLYAWHDGGTTLIAKLGSQGVDEADWKMGPTGGRDPSAGQRASRVSANGTDAVFLSDSSLTGYDNANQAELYHYDYPARSLVCVSCPSTGSRAIFDSVYLTFTMLHNGPLGLDTLARNLSADGQEVFFNTGTPLVPEDTNGTMDVYAWRQEGRGGSVHLISTGRSKEGSYFGDASANGSDVFFFTSQSLVGQDADGIPDLYDARVGPGIASQNPPPGTPVCGGGDCGGSGAAKLLAPSPASATLNGAGNLTPTPPTLRAKPSTSAQVRARALAKALKTCRTKRNRPKRRGCEAQVRRRYGASQIKRAIKQNRRTI
jgi:hypothetical protein